MRLILSAIILGHLQSVVTAVICMSADSKFGHGCQPFSSFSYNAPAYNRYSPYSYNRVPYYQPVMQQPYYYYRQPVQSWVQPYRQYTPYYNYYSRYNAYNYGSSPQYTYGPSNTRFVDSRKGFYVIRQNRELQGRRVFAEQTVTDGETPLLAVAAIKYGSHAGQDIAQDDSPFVHSTFI